MIPELSRISNAGSGRWKSGERIAAAVLILGAGAECTGKGEECFEGRTAEVEIVGGPVKGLYREGWCSGRASAHGV